MTTWGDMGKGDNHWGDVAKGIPEPTTVINPIDRVEIDWLLEMARLGIVANAFIQDLAQAEIRLNKIREDLGA